MDKLYPLISQLMLSEASQAEWLEPFYFPTEISSFSK